VNVNERNALVIRSAIASVLDPKLQSNPATSRKCEDIARKKGSDRRKRRGSPCAGISHRHQGSDLEMPILPIRARNGFSPAGSTGANRSKGAAGSRDSP